MHWSVNSFVPSGGLDAEIAAARRAVGDSPDSVQARVRLAALSEAAHDLEAAFIHYKQAFRLKPDDCAVRLKVGEILWRLRLLEPAKAHCEAVVEIAPTAAAFALLARIQADAGDLESAQASLARALRLAPRDAALLAESGALCKDRGLLGRARECLREALRIDPECREAQSLSLLCMHSGEFSNEELFEAHRNWGRNFRAEGHPEFANVPDPDRPLCIGYVSADFRHHSIARFLEPILSAHDRRSFRVICYDNGARQDFVTQRFKAVANAYRNIWGAPDQDVCDLIRRDEVDILVDLSGHTRGNRLGVFARKAAPIQVTFLGYPATTGLQAMDYRITDAYLDPKNVAENYYTERLVRLPDSLLCYRPLAQAPDAGASPALRTGHLTFGSFNNFSKVTAKMLALWAELLRAIPGARLVILSVPDGEEQRRLRLKFEELGVDSSRLDLYGRVVVETFMELHRHADVALDPFPWNGGTTTCESLWLGVPVVTKMGNSVASRAGLSILANLGLPELVAQDDRGYIEIARRLAADREYLAGLRTNLPKMMEASPLMDSRRYTRNLEAAYRQMWESWHA